MAGDVANRRNVVLIAVVRWLAAVFYTVTCWGLCHDGTSPVDLGTLLIVGVGVAILVSSLGWILEGPGQVDREADR